MKGEARVNDVFRQAQRLNRPTGAATTRAALTMA